MLDGDVGIRKEGWRDSEGKGFRDAVGGLEVAGGQDIIRNVVKVEMEVIVKRGDDMGDLMENWEVLSYASSEDWVVFDD